MYEIGLSKFDMPISILRNPFKYSDVCSKMKLNHWGWGAQEYEFRHYSVYLSWKRLYTSLVRKKPDSQLV